MTPKTNTLLDVTTPSTTATSGVFTTTKQDQPYIVTQATLTAGTGTLVVEGRVLPTDPWVLLWQTTATDSEAVLRHPQMRARLAGGTGATGTVTVDEPVRQVA